MENAAALCIETVLLCLLGYSWCVWKPGPWESHFTATFPTTDPYRDGWGCESCCHSLEKQKDVSVRRKSGVCHVVLTVSEILFQNTAEWWAGLRDFSRAGVGSEIILPSPSTISFICHHWTREQEPWGVQRARHKSWVVLAVVLLLSFSTAPSSQGDTLLSPLSW